MSCDTEWSVGESALLEARSVLLSPHATFMDVQHYASVFSREYGASSENFTAFFIDGEFADGAVPHDLDDVQRVLHKLAWRSNYL